MCAAPTGRCVDVRSVMARFHNSAVFRHAMRGALAISADGHRGGADQVVSLADIRERCAGTYCARDGKRSGKVVEVFHVAEPFTVQ
jgi:hypothetical protein